MEPYPAIPQDFLSIVGTGRQLERYGDPRNHHEYKETSMSIREFMSAPTPESCRLVPFDTVEILESYPPVLVVRGEAPCLNMEVSLQPVFYVDCPEYWRIEVVGCLPGAICLTAIQPYVVWLSLEGIIGSKGIEVVGSSRSERINVSGGCDGKRKYEIAAS